MADAPFDDLVGTWLATLGSVNTRAAYRRDLEVYRTWTANASVPPSRATAADVAAFRDHCVATGSGASTVNRRLAAVTSFYRHAASAWPGPNPARTTNRQADAERGVTAGLADEAAAGVWVAARRAGGKTAVIVGLVLFDGFKTSAALLLDVDHLQMSRAAVSVGDLALHPSTAAAIRAHVGVRREGPLLMGESPTRPSARLTRFGVDYLIKRVGQEAGLPAPLTVNALRATYRSARPRSG